MLNPYFQFLLWYLFLILYFTIDIFIKLIILAFKFLNLLFMIRLILDNCNNFLIEYFQWHLYTKKSYNCILYYYYLYL